MRPNRKPTVLLCHCDSYDPARIRDLTKAALDRFGLKPRGRTLVKPNLVAAGELFRHAYTRPEFTEGVLSALKDRADSSMTELAVGERSGITIPTRFVYKEAGYDPMLARAGVKRYCFDEVPQLEVKLTHPERLRDSIYVPEPVVKADFFVNLPKLKAHPWTTVTFSMKNYIGIQDDRHRLIDHDHALNRKIADLQYVIQPELIAIDGIIAGEGRMLTPIPRALGLVVFGNNQVAVDSVASHIIGVDPMTVEHIRLAYERGFGPIDLDAIEIDGDVSLAEAQARAKGFEVGLVRVEKYFEGTNISAYAGPPPDHDRDGYCWGGCPGVIEEVIEILRLYDDQCDKKLPKIHIVFGHYDGPLDIGYGEKVVFVGDCCTWKGSLGGELVHIKSQYKDRSEIDPHHAEHKDIYVRMARMAAKLNALKSKPYIRLEGCPVSIGELVLLLAELGGIQNPYFDQRQIVGFNLSYLAWRSTQAWRRMRGLPYQIAGDTIHGDAKPVLDEAPGAEE